jgi:HSP20 family protein
MSALEQVREGLNRAWDTLSEGWRELRERATDAVTRFYPPTARGNEESREERLARSGSRWGFLAAEISDGDDSIEVDLEIPGMDPEDFDVQVRGDMLVVRGEKRVSRDEQRGRYHLMQRAYGRFERSLELPASVDDEKAKATYKRGVLHLSLPKSPGSRTNRIPIGS